MAAGLLAGFAKAFSSASLKTAGRQALRKVAKGATRQAVTNTARKVVGRRKKDKDKRRKGRDLAQKLFKQGNKSFLDKKPVSGGGRKMFLKTNLISASSLSKADEVAASKENSLSYFKKALDAINLVAVGILSTIQSQNIKKAARNRRGRTPDRFLPTTKVGKSEKKEKLKFLGNVPGLNTVINFFKNIFLGGFILFIVKFLNAAVGLIKKVIDSLQGVAKTFLAFMKFLAKPAEVLKSITDLFKNIGKKRDYTPPMDRGGQGGLPEDIPEVEQFAEGGEPPVGEPVLVGEEGPELVQFGSKVNIFNTRETIEAAETINNMMRNNFEIINIIKDDLQLNLRGINTEIRDAIDSGELPGLGGGGGGTNAITDKSQSKSLGKRIKDVGKAVTSPFREESEEDPRENFVGVIDSFKKMTDETTGSVKKGMKNLSDPTFFIKKLPIKQIIDGISESAEQIEEIRIPVPQINNDTGSISIDKNKTRPIIVSEQIDSMADLLRQALYQE